MPVPGVVLEILLGILIGPQVLGIAHEGPVLDFLQQLGFWMLFLMAGFEMDPAVLRGRALRNASLGWVVSGAIALGATMLLSRAGVISAPRLTAIALSTTAIGALLPILRDQGLMGPPYGPMVLAAGAAGEAGPVVALSLVLAGLQAPERGLVMFLFTVGAAVAVVAVARARDRYFGAVLDRTMGTSGQFPMRLSIFLLVLLAALSHVLDIDLVIGAFVCGAMARAALPHQLHDRFGARLDGLGSAFLVPIFFVTSGMELDVAAMTGNPVVLAMVPVYALLMLIARGVPALLLYRSDLSANKRIGLALHCGTQLTLVVAITSIAVPAGLMPGDQGAALVGGGIVTMVLYPMLARGFLRPAVPPADPRRTEPA